MARDGHSTAEGMTTAQLGSHSKNAGTGAWRRVPLAGVLSVIGGLVLWELVSRYLVANALFLAGPLQIARAIVQLAGSGELWRHMGISAAEFALGYVIASVLGVICGMA